MDFFLVSYDTPSNHRRSKIANVLQDYGQRVQFSVFEVWLDAPLLDELNARLKQIINDEEDNVRLYGLCAACQKKVIALGQARPPQQPDTIII